MWAIAFVCALNCCGQDTDPNALPPSEAVVADLKQGLQTGSLIFSRGDCLAVKVFSQSSYTHVGGVVVTDGEAIVYDSMNGAGVRKTPFVEYLKQQTPSTVHFVHPKEPFSAEAAESFEQYLESQLGRKYAVKHHLTGRRCEGLHCSEYMTDALMSVEKISAVNPPRVSPGSLLEGAIASNVYVDGPRVELKVVDPPQTEAPSWYQRAWQSTTVCCSKSTTQMRRWILCR